MKFNKPIATKTKTENYAGGEAFKQDPKLEFVSILLTSFVQAQYYRDEDEGLEVLSDLIDKISDKKFLAKAAVYTRREFGMRSVTHVVAGELAKRVKGESWTKNFYNQVVYRPDDITEILAYYLNKYKKPIPNSLKKGLSLAIGKFDEYQLAKYRGEKAAISLVDAVNLLHPKPTAKNKAILKKLIEGTLRSKETWESKLTEAGKKAKDEDQKEKLKKKVWVELVKERKIGYFALLRNLRNILEQAPEVLDEALRMLTDRHLIKRSLVLPFRFITALKQIEETSESGSRAVIVALNKAVDLSLDNVPKFEGKTLVVLDSSGSMEGKPIEIGSLFAAVLYKANEADMMLFSDDAAYVTANPMDSTITIANKLKSSMDMSGTNFHAIFEEANKPYDRIIILSDMQGWIGYTAPTKQFADYMSRVGLKKRPFVYSFDLQGYGTLQFPEPQVFEIAGFSDKVFDIIKLLETDRNALVKKIEEIKL